MNDSSNLREQLRRETGAARAAHGEAEAEIRRRRGQPLMPGDLCVLAQTAELPVEWAILDRKIERSDAASRDVEQADGRLLAVPADTSSWVGTADVAASADEPRGALTLRCGHGAWHAASLFASHQRTGFLTPAIVERARRCWADLKAGTLSGSLAQREVDTESEYLDWQRQVLVPACAAIVDMPADAVPAAGNVVEFKKSHERPQAGSLRWTRASRALGLAASVLLVVSLGLWRQVGVLDERQRAALEDHRQQVARLQVEQESLRAGHRQQIDELRADHERAAGEALRQAEELAAARESQSPRPLVNVPFAVLSAARTRSTAEPLAVPSGASLAMLILQLGTGPSFPTYRLEMLRVGSNEPLWIGEELTTRGAELTVALPRSLLRTGDYTLRLSGVRGGRSERLDEYPLKVTELEGAVE